MIFLPNFSKMPKTANRTIIAVDIDDVLANTTDSLRLFVNQRHGIALTEDHYRIEGEYWSYYETVWEQHGIDEPGLKDAFHSGMHVDQSKIMPITDSIVSAEALGKKYDLIPITSRPEEMKSETQKWLEKYFKDTFTKEPIFFRLWPRH